MASRPPAPHRELAEHQADGPRLAPRERSSSWSSATSGTTYDHRYAPALRELYSPYHPAGLEIVSIHAPTEDADEIRRFARDYRLPYPVVIDEGKPGSAGKTAQAFAIRGRTCAFLIDHEGKIHSVGKPTVNGGRSSRRSCPS